MGNWFKKKRSLLSSNIPRKNAIDAALLEDRVMLSASPMVDVVVHADRAGVAVETSDQVATVDQSLFDSVSDDHSGVEFRFSDTPSDAEQHQLDRSEQATRLELVFVDTGAEDYQQLVEDLLANSDPGRELEVYLLESHRDGVGQISEILAGYEDVDAVHLVSHGTEGQVKLGNTWLSFGSLDGYTGEIAAWNDALRDRADLLIYGCDLAASEDGRALTDAIGSLCDCDVAASTDLTGNTRLGGDWDLEYRTGPIETSVALSADVQQNWVGLLDQTGWQYRRKLTIDNSAQTENLTDFAVLVELDATRIDYSKTQNSGEDIRFFDADDVTPLAYEIEEWNESGTSYVWVKVPQIDGSSSTDFIWMYYGNPIASDGQDAANVWDTNYKAVWHLSETSGIHFDSTSNNFDATAIDGVIQNTTGKIDGADDFDGIDDHLTVTGSDAGLQILGDVTLEAWIWMDNPPASGDYDGIVEFAGAGGDGDSTQNYLYSLTVRPGGDVALGHESGTGTDHFQDMGVSLNTGQWYHLTGVRDVTAKEWNLFIDGVAAGSTFSYSTNTNGGSNGDLWVAWDNAHFEGKIDEIRVSGNARSADWIAAQHKSTTDAFITFSAEESSNAFPTLTLLTSPVDTTTEDTEVEVSFADLTAAGDENDVDGTVDVFIVKSINTGTLKIGATAGTATAWVAVTNDTIDASNNAYWTPDLDDTGIQNAFAVVAKDDGGLESTPNVTAQIDVTAPTGMAIWRNGSSTTPEFNLWDGATFGTAANTVSVGDYRHMIGAEAPTRDEIIVLGVTAGNDVSGMMWNGSSWSALPFNNLADNLSESFYFSFAVSYESQSGDAVVVWRNGTSGTTPLSYRVWNGSTWSNAATITSPVSGDPTHIYMASDPHSDEMVLVAGGRASEHYALVWDGENWGNSQVLASGLLDDFNVAYEQQSGEALVVYGKGDTNVYHRTWNGSAWSAEGSVAKPADSSGNVYRLVVGEGVGTDRIAMGAVTTGNSIWLNVWDGTSWEASQTATTTATGSNRDGVGVAIESQTGQALAAYGETGTTSVRYRTWNETDKWSAELTGPDVGDQTNTIVLEADPNSEGVMLSVQDDGSDLNYVLWEGSAWGTASEQETNTSEVKNRPFAFVWTVSAGTNDAPTLTLLTSPVDTTNEDTEVEVSFADLTAAGNENDVDGTVDAFLVKSIGTGTLKIGATAGSATAWVAVTNDTIDASNNAYWTPDLDVTGTQNAFAVVAKDDGGLESTPNVTSQIYVTAQNDAPTLTLFTSPVDTTTEDTEVEVSFADLTIAGNENDVDGTVDAFIVKSISTGTLKIGATAGTATAWVAVTNDTIDASNNAYWTPDLDDTGIQNAFAVVAKDDGGLESTPNVTAQISVAAVNDEAVLAAMEGAPLPYTEGDGPVAITSTVTLADVDDTSIETATIQITGNYASGQDLLEFADTPNITGSWATATGTLTLTGPDLNAAFKSALRNVTYRNTSSDPSTATRTISFSVFDGDDPSSIVTRDIMFTAVNSAPVLSSIEPSEIAYTENDGQVSLTSTILVGDLDDAVIKSATIQITGNYTLGQDLLSFVDTPQITGTWDAAAGTMSLSGSDTLANYRTALTNVKFENTSEDPATVIRTVSFSVDDGDDLSNILTRDINFTATNDVPTLTAFTTFIDVTNEDTEVGLTLAELKAQGDETDVDGTVDAFVVKSIASGTLKIGATAGSATAWAAGSNDTIDATKNVYWTPDLDTTGTQNAFAVVAKDDGGLESTPNVTAQINVTAQNDAPTLTLLTSLVDTTNEDTEVEVSFADLTAAGDENDVDGTVDAFIVKTISSGTLKIGAMAGTATAWAAGTNDTIDAGNNAYWTPDLDDTGTQNAFAVVAKDDGGLESTPNVTAQINVTADNDTPTLTLLTGPVDTTTEDTEVEVSFADLTIAGNENDVDGTVDAFIVKSISTGTLKIGATAGTATAWVAVTNDTIDASNNAYWTPDLDDTGIQNAFAVVAKDDGGLESTPNVTAQINITADNDAPTLTLLTSPVDTTTEDTEVEVSFTDLTTAGNENDVDGTVDAFIVKSISTGTLKIGATAGSATAWAAGTNDTIDASNNAYWTPALDANGTLNAFDVVAKDNSGAESVGNVTAQVSVTSVNDIPTLTSFAAVIDTNNEDTEVELTLAELKAQGDENDTDGTVDSFVVKSITSGTLKIGATAGSATAWAAGTNDTVDASNNAYWTPALDANGTLNAFDLVAKDNSGAESVGNLTAQVSVTPVNDIPTLTSFAAVIDTTNEDTEVELTLAELKTQGDEADVDGTVDAFIVKSISTGTLKIGATAGTATAWAAGSNDTIDATKNAYWTPDLDTTGTQNAFAVVAKDDGGLESTTNVTAQISVAAVNYNTPVADTESFTVLEGGTATETDLDVGTSLLDGDTDIDLPNDTLTVNTTPVVDASFGLLTLNANGTFSYTHDGSENFSDTFTYEVRDAVGNADTATVTITISPVNDHTPVADNEGFTVYVGGMATEANLDVGSSLLDGDTDIDLPNDTLTVNTTSVVGPSFGVLVLNANGTFSYSHDGSPNFSDSFTYEVSDAVGNTDTATVTITITNGNPPVADAESFTVLEGGTATEADLDVGVILLDGDTDLDLPADTLTVDTTPVSGPSFGSLSLNSNGTFSYTHDGSENFSDSFTYEVSDAVGNTDTATVTITVTPVNDNSPAFTTPAAVSINENTTFVQTVNAADADLPTQTAIYSISGGADQLLFSINVATGDLSFQAVPDFETPADANSDNVYEVEVTADDGNGGATIQDMSVTVTDANDVPTSSDDRYSVDNDETLTVAAPGVLAGDLDEDSDSMTVSLVTGPSNGDLTLASNGSFTYTPTANYSGTDSFTYQVDDGNGGTASATVTIMVNAAGGSLPVAPPDSNGPPDAAPPVVDDDAPLVDAAPPLTEDVKAEPPPTQARVPQGRSPEPFGPLFVAPVAAALPHVEPIELNPRLTYRSVEKVVRTVRQVLPPSAVEALEKFVAPFDAVSLWNDLSELQSDLQQDANVPFLVAGSSAAATGVMTVGYVLWTIRSGWLVTSLLVQMPAWRLVDPLVVLNYLDEESSNPHAEEEEEDDSLESLLVENESEPEWEEAEDEAEMENVLT